MTDSAVPAPRNVMNSLYAVGFLARASYALARTPVLALFAASLGRGQRRSALRWRCLPLPAFSSKCPLGSWPM